MSSSDTTSTSVIIGGVLAVVIGLIVYFTTCAGGQRACSSCVARAAGSDWVVVELTEASALPYRCWQLEGVSITNEEHSDGIYWKTSEGHLVHVAGSYDYIQVSDKDWAGALRELNLTPESCRIIRERQFDPVTNTYKNPE